MCIEGLDARQDAKYGDNVVEFFGVGTDATRSE